MTNRDAIRRQLAIIEDSLQMLDVLCDTEIVGNDARHLECDIKGAQRELVRTDGDKIEESYEVKPLYDRLKAIQTSLRVLRNTLDRSDDAIANAMTACAAISREVEDPETDNDL
jgi:hypothetical protein